MMRKILMLTALMAAPLTGFSAEAKAQSGEYCREYQKTVTVGGKIEEAYGTACYRPDGDWEIVDLKGSNDGRNKLRDIIRDDIRYEYERKPYRHVEVRERYYDRGYRPYYTRAGYSPFYIDLRFGDYNDHHRSYKKKYKKAKYKHHHKYHRHHHGYKHGYGHHKHHKGHKHHRHHYDD